jgi:hypothetical protein
MELLQLVDVRVEEASRPLREEVAALKLLLARVGDSLEGGLGLTPMQASFPLDSSEQKSSVVEEEHLYSCISPRGSPYQSSQLDVSAAYESEGMDVILDPVLHFTPEFHELCEESSEVLSLELGSFEALAILPPQSPASLASGAVRAHCSLQVDPLGTSMVASTPPSVVPSFIGGNFMPELQELCGESSVASMEELGSLESMAVAISPSPLLSEPLDFVDTEGVLAPNSEAFFGKEIYDLLVSLEAASPGYGKEVACVLAGKASKSLIRKVEKSFTRRRKKRYITIKFSQLLESSYSVGGDPDVVN